MALLEGAYLRCGERRQRFLRRLSLQARSTVFLQSDPPLPSRGQSLFALTVGLGHDHPADLLSLDEVVAEYFYNGALMQQQKREKRWRRALPERKELGTEMMKEREEKAPRCFPGSLHQ